MSEKQVSFIGDISGVFEKKRNMHQQLSCCDIHTYGGEMHPAGMYCISPKSQFYFIGMLNLLSTKISSDFLPYYIYDLASSSRKVGHWFESCQGSITTMLNLNYAPK